MRDVLDPSTGAVVDHVPELTPADVDAVMTRTVEAHAEWSRSKVRVRRDVLREIARLVRVNAEHLARLESARPRPRAPVSAPAAIGPTCRAAT